MNSSELYDTLVSLDEKYTEEAETFLFTNKGDFTKNAQCKGIKTNRLTGVAVSIAIIPLLAAITVFSVVIIKNNTRKKSETTKVDDVETIGNTGIRFKDLTKMTKEQILENDEALLWFRVLSVDERHSLIGKGQKCTGGSVESPVINRAFPNKLGFDLVVPENVEAYYCKSGSMVVFGDSDELGEYKYCMRYAEQWNDEYESRINLGMRVIKDSITRFYPVPYSSFSTDKYGISGIKMIYCTRYKDETIPVGASMSQEAYEKLKKDYHIFLCLVHSLVQIFRKKQGGKTMQNMILNL